MNSNTTILDQVKKATLLLALLFASISLANTKEEAQSGDLKTEIKEYIAHHLQDAYDFSIFLHQRERRTRLMALRFPLFCGTMG